MDDRLELHRVEMPPGPLRGVVVDSTGLPAFRARRLGADGPAQADFHLLAGQIEFHVLHLPWSVDPKEESVMLVQRFIAKSHARECRRWMDGSSLCLELVAEYSGTIPAHSSRAQNQHLSPASTPNPGEDHSSKAFGLPTQIPIGSESRTSVFMPIFR
jgi:hypothetical protein